MFTYAVLLIFYKITIILCSASQRFTPSRQKNGENLVKIVTHRVEKN